MQTEKINKQTEEPKKSNKKPIRLPFDNRKQDSIEWAYDHRIGLFVVIGLYLIAGTYFLFSKIDIGKKSYNEAIEIDLGELARLEQEKQRLQKQIEQQNQSLDWSKIRNTSSNENALNENLEDSKHTDVAALNAEAAALQAKLKATQEGYGKGLKEANAIHQQEGDKGSCDQNNDKKVKGRVTVSFSLTNPTRYSRHLIKPAYRCEGGGEVVVAIVVNQNGKVLSARVIEGGDECMKSTAVESALNSTFDINSKAPTKQAGTITYIFIPQ